MSDYTRTPNLGLYKPNYALDVGQWGNHLNANADMLDAAVAVAVLVPPGGSIQAVIDALPPTGGAITLAPNTTYVVTTAIVSSKPNVRVSAPTWNTIVQRGPTLAGIILQLTGAGCLIEGMTFDGNGAVNTTGQAEAQIAGVNSRITNVQVINSAATMNIAVSGAGGRVDHCTITGLGIALSTERGEGIWAANDVPVTLDHNTISGTGLCAISALGPGIVINANTCTGCRCYTANPGGIIVVYPNTVSGAGTIVSNNFVGQGGGVATGGLELNGNNVTVTGNTIVNQYGHAIGLNTGRGFVVTGNTILNVGLDNSGNEDGIAVGAGVTDFLISANRISDDNATPKMRWAISVAAGASDRYAIVGNIVVPNSQPNTQISDGGTGANKVIANNAGHSATPYVTSAASITIPPEWQTFDLLTSGTLTITSIAASSRVNGTVKVARPNAAFVFTAGNNINNTVTTTPNVPLLMTCDETGKWWLR